MESTPESIGLTLSNIAGIGMTSRIRVPDKVDEGIDENRTRKIGLAKQPILSCMHRTAVDDSLRGSMIT